MGEKTLDNISDYIIHRCLKQGKYINNVRLQKLIFAIQEWFMEKYSESLFEDKIELWALGPIFRMQYERFLKFGTNPINEDPGEGNLPEYIRTEIDTVIEQVYFSLFGQEENFLHKEEKNMKSLVL
jgi:uncharacterized phage-associated protein